VDPYNPTVILGHVKCAAVECPLSLAHDRAFFGPGLDRAASTLVQAGLLSPHPQQPACLHYSGPKDNPAADLSLRMIDPNR